MLEANYKQIWQSPFFKQFSATMKNTRGTTLTEVKVDELFISTYEKMSASFEHTLKNTIDTLETKIADIKTMN